MHNEKMQPCVLSFGGEDLSERYLEYCIKNLRRFSQSVYDQIEEEFPHVKQKIRGCLDYCDECKNNPYVLVSERRTFITRQRKLENKDPSELRVLIEQALLES